MLCFVMALKSKQVSKDWSRVCHLFESTLESIYQQTDPDFRVIVVCHETPRLRGQYDSRLEFINVDFPVPAQITNPLCMKDKWTKIHHGLVRAGELRPDFLMNMDADDLVSDRLVAHTKAHPDSNGWFFNVGYYYRFGSRWVIRKNQFDRYCGTSAIVSSRLINYPTDLSPASYEGSSVLRWHHTAITQKLQETGTPLEPLPFPGAVYIQSHGDNDSHMDGRFYLYTASTRLMLKSLPSHRWCTRRIRREFGIDRLTREGLRPAAFTDGLTSAPRPARPATPARA